MARFTHAELEAFRVNSHCEDCLHYGGCALWMTILLLNEETFPWNAMLVPDITEPCPMFAKPWWKWGQRPP